MGYDAQNEAFGYTEGHIVGNSSAIHSLYAGPGYCCDDTVDIAIFYVSDPNTGYVWDHAELSDFYRLLQAPSVGQAVIAFREEMGNSDAVIERTQLFLDLGVPETVTESDDESRLASWERELLAAVGSDSVAINPYPAKRGFQIVLTGFFESFEEAAEYANGAAVDMGNDTEVHSVSTITYG